VLPISAEASRVVRSAVRITGETGSSSGSGTNSGARLLGIAEFLKTGIVSDRIPDGVGADEGGGRCGISTLKARPRSLRELRYGNFRFSIGSYLAADSRIGADHPVLFSKESRIDSNERICGNLRNLRTIFLPETICGR
jgi:hypothetical protein